MPVSLAFSLFFCFILVLPLNYILVDLPFLLVEIPVLFCFPALHRLFSTFSTTSNAESLRLVEDFLFRDPFGQPLPCTTRGLSSNGCPTETAPGIFVVFA